VETIFDYAAVLHPEMGRPVPVLEDEDVDHDGGSDARDVSYPSHTAAS
jgi:hypothetical protein